jgi:ubiquinone/menaquinone biosynthesis C-methylase UbiE
VNVKSAFYQDDDHVGELTKWVNACGITCLQVHRLAPSERTHVGMLLAFFDPPPGIGILDLGAGTGAVADMMQELRPDLTFTLLNHSQTQLDMASDRHQKICASFEKIPALPHPIRAAMMTYAIGHGDVHRVLSEVSRVLPPGGLFFLYDITSDRSDNAKALRDKLDYIAYKPDDIITAASLARLDLDRMERPREIYSAHMRPVMPDADYTEIFSGLNSMLFRFRKRFDT